MRSKGKTISRAPVSIHELFERKKTSQGELLRRHAPLKKQWLENFRAEMTERAEHAEGLNRLYAPLREILTQDPRTAEAATKLVGSHTLRKSRLSPPKPRPERRRVSLGSLEVTFTPPYDFWWSWATASDRFAVAEAETNKDAGTLRTFFDTTGRGSAAGGFAGVGLYYAPITDCPAALSVRSNPSFDFSWDLITGMQAVHSDGWIELEVRSFNHDGTMEDVVATRRDILWSRDRWWAANDKIRDSRLAHAMSVSLTADRDHYYNIWIKCGGSIFVDPGQGLALPFAKHELTVAVPAITCTLG